MPLVSEAYSASSSTHYITNRTVSQSDAPGVHSKAYNCLYLYDVDDLATIDAELVNSGHVTFQVNIAPVTLASVSVTWPSLHVDSGSVDLHTNTEKEQTEDSDFDLRWSPLDESNSSLSVTLPQTLADEIEVFNSNLLESISPVNHSTSDALSSSSIQTALASINMQTTPVTILPDAILSDSSSKRSGLVLWEIQEICSVCNTVSVCVCN